MHLHDEPTSHDPASPPREPRDRPAAVAPSSHRELSGIVRRLVAFAETEELLLDLLADALKRGDQGETFRLAAQLTGVNPENGTADLHQQPKTQNKP
jgi:hypothetical protein